MLGNLMTKWKRILCDVFRPLGFPRTKVVLVFFMELYMYRKEGEYKNNKEYE